MSNTPDPKQDVLDCLKKAITYCRDNRLEFSRDTYRIVSKSLNLSYTSDAGAKREFGSWDNAVAEAYKSLNLVVVHDEEDEFSFLKKRLLPNKKLYKVLVVPDVHVPFEHKKAVDAMLRAGEIYQPDEVVQLGDLLDCVAPETKILTYNLDWVRADSLKIGDRIIAFDEYGQSTDKLGRNSQRKLRTAVIEGTETIKRPVYRFTMSTGETLVSSIGHLWLCRTSTSKAFGWRTTNSIADTIKSGGQIYIHKPTYTWNIPQKTYENGFIEAAFDGEGHITFHKEANNFAHLVFSQKDNQFLSKVRSIIHAKGYETYEHLFEPTGVVALQIKGGLWEQAKFIGSFDIPRFKDKWIKNAPIDGYAASERYPSYVVSVEYLGEQDVVSLQTTTKTFFAEGFSSHNCYKISRFVKDPSRGASVQREVELGHSFLDRLKKRTGAKRGVFIEGNHESRIKKYVFSHAGELTGLAALNVENLLELKSIGYDFIADHEFYAINDVYFTHGEFAQKFTSAKHLETYSVTIIHGHTHRLQMHCNKFMDRQIEGWEMGCLSSLNVSRDYVKCANWQHGFGTVDIYGDEYWIQGYHIRDGRVNFRGKMIEGKK